MGTPVVSAGLCQCSFGIAPSPFNALPLGRPFIQGRPAGTIMDFIPFLNIEPFSLCMSPLNPEVIAAFGIPMPCMPITVAPWIPVEPTVILGGEPALDESSILMCLWGGVISVLFPGEIGVSAGP